MIMQKGSEGRKGSLINTRKNMGKFIGNPAHGFYFILRTKECNPVKYRSE